MTEINFKLLTKTGKRVQCKKRKGYLDSLNSLFFVCAKSIKQNTKRNEHIVGIPIHLFKNFTFKSIFYKKEKQHKDLFSIGFTFSIQCNRCKSKEKIIFKYTSASSLFNKLPYPKKNFIHLFFNARE
jgi:hypothetical protein